MSKCVICTFFKMVISGLWNNVCPSVDKKKKEERKENLVAWNNFNCRVTGAKQKKNVNSMKPLAFLPLLAFLLCSCLANPAPSISTTPVPVRQWLSEVAYGRMKDVNKLWIEAGDCRKCE